MRIVAVVLWCSLGTFALGAAAGEAADARRAMFLDLVKERHVPDRAARAWSDHVGTQAVWVGRGLRVATRAEVQGQQIATGKRVDIQDFTAHDYGDAAVLTYLVVEHQPQNGGEVTTRLRKMDTYLRRDGRWQLVANAEVVGRPDRKAVVLDAAALDRLAGSYETEFDGQVLRTRIWRDGSRLFARTDGQEAGELLPLSATLFFDASEPQEGGPENEFLIDADGRVREWLYRDGAVVIRSRRVPAP